MTQPSAFSRGARVGTVAIVAIWVIALCVVAPAAAEFALFLKWDAFRGRDVEHPKPEYARLREAYQPFAVQYVHPIYLFFYPFDPAERVRLSNSVCRITADGYRGPGPEAAGGRKLAFLLGGSAAFGQYATHDSTTITGYLNRMQDEYFFANAGVSSWNSTQELARLQFQLLEARPQLVISYDGSNDLGNTIFYGRKGLAYPAGTPESFDDLLELVGNVRGERSRAVSRPLVQRVLPRLSAFVAQRWGQSAAAATPRYTPLPDDAIEASAGKYAHNVSLMSDVARARGVRFISAFQPILPLHRRVSDSLLDARIPKYLRADFERYHAAVMRVLDQRIERVDLGRLYDTTGDTLGVFDPDGRADISDTTIIFVDAVHVTDIGNRRVAEALLRQIFTRRPSSPS